MSTFRACDARRKGLDRTLFGHVAVVFVDEVQPFLTGCVAIDNQVGFFFKEIIRGNFLWENLSLHQNGVLLKFQARFAEKSGALALIVGPGSRIQRNKAVKVA